MGFFKCLGYVAAGVGAVVLAPATGGSSLALAIGALGTTTAAGAAIGLGVGATAAAIDHGITSSNDAKAEGIRQGRAEGYKAGEYASNQKYEAKIATLTERLKGYHDADQKLIGLFAVGLAMAQADGIICKEEEEELDAFVSGCMSSYRPQAVKDTISQLRASPPSLERALEFARNARLPKRDIDDVMDIVAQADGNISISEEMFIYRWKNMSDSYDFA